MTNSNDHKKSFYDNMVHPDQRELNLFLTFVIIALIILLFVLAVGGPYSRFNMVVVGLNNASALLFAVYATTITTTDPPVLKELEEKKKWQIPGKTHKNNLCIIVGVSGGFIFFFFAAIVYSPNYAVSIKDMGLKSSELITWTSLFVFYGFELWGITLGGLKIH